MNAQPNGQAPATVNQLTSLTLRQVILGTLTVLAVTLLFLLFYRFYSVVFLVFVAIAVQIALDPLVNRLARLGVHKMVAMFVLYLLLFGLLSAVLWFGAAPLAQQVRDVTGTLPSYYQNARDLVLNSSVGLVRGLGSVLPAEPSLPLLMAAVNQGSETAGAAAESAATTAAAVAATAEAETGTTAAQSWEWIVLGAKTFFGLFAVFAIAAYWTLEGSVIVRKLILKAPATRREELRALVTESQGKIASFFRGQLILCGIVGGAATIAYLLLGIPNALLLGLSMALFESVPLVGPFLGAVPALLVTMSSAPDKLLWVVGALVLIQVLESNLLVPRVMDRSVGVNAIISMLALVAFGALFGLLGALLAVPLAAILQIVLNRVLFNRRIGEEGSMAEPEAADIGRSHVGVMRLEAQYVMQAVRTQARNDEESDKPVNNSDDRTEDEIEAIASELDTLLANAEMARQTEVAA